MSTSNLVSHERARNLLSLIDSLEIENDFRISRRTLDDWRTEMLSMIEKVHLLASHRLDSLKARLDNLKRTQAETLRQQILPMLVKVKHLSVQEQREINEKVERIEKNLKAFGLLLTKVGQDEKRLVEQIETLKNIQRENLQLSDLDDSTLIKRRFKLDTGYSSFLAISEDEHLLIEDDNHLVLYNNERRVHEIPWNQGEDKTFTGAIKDLTFSNYLKQFCVLSSLNLFTFDIERLTLEKSEQIKPSTGSHFQSVACLPNKSDVYFILMTSGSRTTVERWSLLSGSLIRRWYHDVFEPEDRFVSSARANEKCLAFCIKQQKTEKSSINEPNSSWRVDLFDMNLVRMYRGIHLKTGGLSTFVTPFDDRSWLVTNGNDLWLLGEQAECVEEKKLDQKEKLLNIIVKETNKLGQREFILKFGQPAELRLV